MTPIQREIIEPLEGVIGATLTAVYYKLLKLEFSPDEIEDTEFYTGGEVVLIFDNGEKRYFSWAENVGYDSHFTLAILKTSHFIEDALEEIDASATILWADAVGARLIGSQCLGWDASPHVIELDFGCCRKLIGSARETRFGDADDVFCCDASDSKDRLTDASSLWSSAKGEQGEAGTPSAPGA